MIFDCDYYKGLISKLNEILHLDIKILPATAGIVLPQVESERQVIRLNPKIETLMLLFDLSLTHKPLSGRAVNHYILYHLYLGKGLYVQAGEMLHLLEQDVIAIRTAAGGDKCGITIDTLLLQTSFALCHEIGHIYYRYNAGKKKEEIEGVREIIDDMAEHLGKGRNLLPRWMNALYAESTKRDFDDVLDYGKEKINDNLCEEIACDLLAYNLVMNLMQSSGFNREEMALEGANVAMVIGFLETYKQLEDAYLSSRKEIQHHNVRINTLRYSCLFYLVWEWLEGKKERANTYLKHLNAYGCDSRYDVCAGFFSNLVPAEYLRNFNGTLDARAVQKLEREYKSLDEGIRNIIH